MPMTVSMWPSAVVFHLCLRPVSQASSCSLERPSRSGEKALMHLFLKRKLLPTLMRAPLLVSFHLALDLVALLSQGLRSTLEPSCTSSLPVMSTHLPFKRLMMKPLCVQAQLWALKRLWWLCWLAFEQLKSTSEGTDQPPCSTLRRWLTSKHLELWRFRIPPPGARSHSWSVLLLPNAHSETTSLSPPPLPELPATSRHLPLILFTMKPSGVLCHIWSVMGHRLSVMSVDMQSPE
mmetsp:Transcript_47712/g.152226  ORF Transcript_47712/g.152226 Transcript_47712/m.152226 type:complete len:235 (-) Transcript_47712:427-1131(-)